MEINKIVNIIENFAPLELQESWDCSGFQIYIEGKDVKKILLCLSVTENIIDQAIEKNCDLIISHHPLFFVPFGFKRGISIYSAHTNLDKTEGGTTDTLIDVLGFDKAQKEICKLGDFLRLVELKEEILLDDFIKLLKRKLNLQNIRVGGKYIECKCNKEGRHVQRIAFCAGSGMDFLEEVKKNNVDVFVTGDVKYHNVLDSDVIIIDIGHFESEHPVLKTLDNLLKPLGIEVATADEKSPFINY